jgi:uncharacterized membrane protein
MDQNLPQPPRTDLQMETSVGNLLRGGVIAAAVLVFSGGAVYLVRHGTEWPGYHVFQGEPSDLCAVTGILTDVVLLRGRGIIQLGLLVLIATPVMRVVVSLVAFTRRRDRIYVVVTLIVLVLLLYSLFGGGM